MMPTLSENSSSSQALPKPEAEPLAQQWTQRLEAARKHWSGQHKRIAHNRKLVAGFDWTKDPSSDDFCTLRANLIFSTMAAILPHIYARNPEISVTPLHPQANLKLFCQTLQTVVNRALLEAQLKKRAKAAVWSAMTSYFGIVKVMYQRDLQRDALMQTRTHDVQDHLAKLQQLKQQADETTSNVDQEAKQAEFEQALASLEQQVDVPLAEGLVLDRVLTEHLLIDPSINEFWDYEQAGWMAQIVPIKRADAEALYQVDLSGATPYEAEGENKARSDGRLASLVPTSDSDTHIRLIEIWDRRTERVYTMAEGCPGWVRAPYSPTKVGARWYPFFLLPFSVTDGSLIAPCLVDLTEKLQQEYNETRDKFAAHRELNKPHWLVSVDTDKDTIKRHTDATLGEVVLVRNDGRPLNQVIMPGTTVPINPADYDTGQIRLDWEQVTGLQDAARSTVDKAKTATEASIMQQALSGRISEFRDKIEDWLQEIAQYAAQILLQELGDEQVARYLGVRSQSQEDKVKLISQALGLALPAFPPVYDWPQLSREQVFAMVQIEIRAGTTGAPDKLEQQQTWLKVLPLIQPMITQLMQMKAQGGDTGPLEELLRETLRRFDERLDIESFLPSSPPQTQPQPQPSMPNADLLNSPNPLPGV